MYILLLFFLFHICATREKHGAGNKTKPNQTKTPNNNKNIKQNIKKVTHDKDVGCEGREACFEERGKVKQD